MRCPVNSEGIPLIAFFGILSFAVKKFSRWLAALFAIMAGFSAYFFRDPERDVPNIEGAIVSPADGRVVSIVNVDHAPFIDGPAQRISIFLSIFDVHINRSPIEGKVTWREYKPGRFLPANLSEASDGNEQNSIGIDDSGYKVMVRQIAGIIARRIVCWANPGDRLARGERFGLIRFGSRTDIFLPTSARLAIKIGQKVHGGSTIIAYRN